MDVMGCHPTTVVECTCSGCLPFYEQLLCMKLFPATPIKPRTVFTFSVLREFQTANFAAKVTIWDFWSMIRRKTNNVRPGLVPVRSRFGEGTLKLT